MDRKVHRPYCGKQSEKLGEWQVRASCGPESNGVLGTGMFKNFLTAL